MKKIGSIIFVVAILLGIYVGFESFQPPKVKFDEKTMTITEAENKMEPSLAVTMGHLKEITKKPHPMGSIENKRVRKYLVEQMEQMGYEVEQDPFLVEQNEKIVERATIEGEVLPDKIEGVNLMAQIEGTQSVATTFVVAHYDSTAHGPGAADDAIAVASILEAMRMAKIEKPQNDIVFLLTDGEELGLLGAEHFVQTHLEWKDKADFLINFEARGNRGGLVMFQTAKNNHRMLQHLTKGSQSPIAVSIATEVYNRVPNGTDLTQFLNAGYTGVMNFAVVEGAEHYHTPTDSYEQIDRSTANHYMMMITDLTTYFGNVDTAERDAKEDAVYFPIAKGNIITWSQTMTKVIAGFSIVLSGIWMFLTIKKKKLALKEIGIALGVIVLSIVISMVLGKIGGFLTRFVFGVPAEIPAYLRWPGSPYMFVGIIGATILFMLFALKTVASKTKIFTASNFLYQLILIFGTIGTIIAVPGASYLFIVPLFIQSLLLLIQSFVAKFATNEAQKILASIFAFIQAILYAPVIYLLFITLTIPALPIIAALTAFVVLGFGSFYFQQQEV